MLLVTDITVYSGRYFLQELINRNYKAKERSCTHKEGKKAFGYTPMTFYEGLKIEVEEYLKKSR